MNKKKAFIKKRLDHNLKRSDLVLRLMIGFMAVVVLYDSFIHLVPLYYMLFCVAGLYIGKLFKFSHKVHYNEQQGKLTLIKNRWSMVLLLVLLLIRFYLGRILLESIHILWVTDGILLLFIGIYYAKWKVLIRQIEELYIDRLSK
jgi:Ca2+/Na+ antiporter